jgi:hypothetical protein
MKGRPEHERNAFQLSGRLWINDFSIGKQGLSLHCLMAPLAADGRAQAAMPVMVAGRLANETAAFCIANRNRPLDAVVKGVIKGHSLKGISLDGFTHFSLGLAEQIGFLVGEELRRHAVLILQRIDQGQDRTIQYWLKNTCGNMLEGQGGQGEGRLMF